MAKGLICKRLKGLMTESGTTVTELAAKLGISASSLSRKINGQQTLWAREVCFITQYFGFSEWKNVFPEMYASVLSKEAV